MATLHTVTGPIDTEELGFTLVHEHLIMRWEGPGTAFPHLFDDAGDLKKMVETVSDVAGKGVQTICDPTVFGLGRNLDFMQQVSEATGVRVVPATGIFTYTELPMFFAHRTVDQIADAFTHDIEHGIEGTPIRASFLKCAMDKLGLTNGVEKVLRATARAHRRTGVPIMTHSHAASHAGLVQQDIFEEEGVDLSRVIIGHSGDSEDLEYLQKVADRGSFLGMDRYGMEHYLPTEARNRTLLEMWKRGYGDRLMMSQDSVTLFDPEQWAVEERESLIASTRNWRMSYLVDEVFPQLEAMGLDRSAIDSIMTDNVRRWFEHVEPY